MDTYTTNTKLTEMDGTSPLVFMPPTSKKLRGDIGLDLSVQLVSLSVCDARVTLSPPSGTVRSRILKFGV